MENTPSVSSGSPISALPSSQPSSHKRWKGLIVGLLGVFVLGGGVAAYFVTSTMMNAAAGIPIPTFEGTPAFRVPEESLLANATYTREDGQIVHYIDKPTVIEKAWTEKNHHILIKFTDAFGLTGEVNPEAIILGRAFVRTCKSDTTHVKDTWYYVYTSPTYEVEKKGTFPMERFFLGNCRDILRAFEDKYTGRPKIKAGDLVYVAIPPAEVTKLEAAKHGGGTSGKLRAATSWDSDDDGLLDLVEESLGSKATEYDTDLDGVGDSPEVVGGEYAGEMLRIIVTDTVLWSNPDTDGDGLGDALELGFTIPQNPDPAKSTLFIADSDPTTVTKPNVADTDGGGKSDGEEDKNKNGKFDEGETDPNNKDDDVLPPLPNPPSDDQCKNGIDDDGDTLIDLADAGCANADDTNEGDGATDLEVKKTGPAEAADDSKVTYTITVTNKGPDAITSAAAVLDHVPAGLEYIDAESHADCEAMTNNNTIRCGNIRLAKDASVAFSLVFHVTTTLDVCGKVVTNKAMVSETPQGDSNEANNESGVSTTITCVAPPLTCGNGTLESGETCDDRNVVSGDGCSALCATETGYTCTGAPSVCTKNPVCGNGTQEGAEECDDGNAVNTDACNECKLTFCGDRIVQNPNGRGVAEECDEDTPICTADCKKIQFPEL